jgi:hypothetical protein
MDRLAKSLGVRFYISPDVAIAAVARGLLRIVDAFLLGELPEEGVPEHVRGDLDPLAGGAVRVRLRSGAPQNLEGLHAVEVAKFGDAKAGAEEDGDHGVIAEPLVGAAAGPDAKCLGSAEEPERSR